MSVLLHLFGPFAIHSYGFFIACGLTVFMFLVKRDERFEKLALESIFFDIVTVGILSAIFGGRLLYILSENELPETVLDFFAFWHGGLSILGGVVGVLCGVSLFLRYKKVPVLPFFDLIAVYSPLLQAAGRVGCFYAGCCYGLPCFNKWAVRYTDVDSYAPLGISMHPTQLYSAIVLGLLFLFLFFYIRKVQKIPGCILAIYIFCIAAERFVIDFWRADRCMVTAHLSYNQLVAVCLVCIALVSFFVLKEKKE